MKKNILLSLISLPMVLGFCGCSGFLTEKPKSLQSASTGFDDEASLKLLLSGVYEAHDHLYHTSDGLGLIGEAGSDEVICNPFLAGANQLYQHSGKPEDSYRMYQRWYGYNFDIITRATNVIFYAEKAAPTPKILGFIAEAKTLRAIAYFRLAQTFGPVPMVNQPIEVPIDYGAAREPLKVIYAQIVKDLEEATAEHYMQAHSAGSAEPYRLSHWTAKAFLGKVYLTMASSKETGLVDEALDMIGKKDFGHSGIEQTPKDLYALAQETLKDIIENSGISLNTEPGGYGKLFCSENINKYKEVMWAISTPYSLSGPLAAGKGLGFLCYYGLSQGQNFPVLNCGASANSLSASGTMIIDDDVYWGYREGDRRAYWNFTGGIRLYPGAKLNDKGKIFEPDDPAFYYPHVFYLNYNVDRGFQHAPEMSGIPRREIGMQMCKKQFQMQQFRVTKYRFTYADSITARTPYMDMKGAPRTFPLMRYADVLLMYAEARLKATGDESDPAALDAMNAIRARARGHYDAFEEKYGLIPEGRALDQAVPAEDTPEFPDYTSITMDDIMAERRWELCYENIRWYDLVRTGRLIKTYNEIFLSPSGAFVHRTDIDAHDCLFPIPLHELNQTTDRNAFFQNPGY